MQDWEPRALPSDGRCDRWAEQCGSWFDGEVVWTWEKTTAGGRVLRLRTQRLGDVQLGAFRDDRFRFRPMLRGNPAPWSEFYAVTHPPIPEGWEAVGEWENPVTFKEGADAVLLEDGNIAHSLGRALQGLGGQARTYDGWGVCLHRARPAIPEGWEAVGDWHDTHAPCSEVYDGTLLLDGRIVTRGERFRGSDERRMGLHVRRVTPPADWGDVPREVTLRPNIGRGGPRNDVTLSGAYVGRVFDQSEEGYSAHGTDQMPVAGSPFVSLPAAIVALTGRREKG